MIEFDIAFRPGDDFAVTFGGEVPLEAEMGQVMEVLATEERTVELSMPSGNQVILPTSSKGMRKVTIQKPDTLLSENIKKDVVIGGVTGALLAPPTGPYIEYTSLDSSGRVFTAKFRGTIVPEYAFAYLAELTSVDMPDNVIAIGDNGFYRCPKLSLTSLPSGITSLGDYAFADCSMLTLTSLPSGITSLGDYVFRDCPRLSLTSLPSGITSIGQYAFRNCSKMVLTSLPSGITSIGDFAFLNCYQLSLTALPSGITSIGQYAFNNCPRLALTTLPSGITSLPTAAFQYCPKLALTALPSGLTSIGAYAFKQGTGLASITLPPALTAIGNQAFANCYNLKVCDCTECTAVPTLGASVFQNAHADFKILVPSALEEEWKAAANWSSYASQIIGV